MRKVFSLALILLGTGFVISQPRIAHGGTCQPTTHSCPEVDVYVEICEGGLGARICTVYQCSNTTSYTCCTECEGPN